MDRASFLHSLVGARWNPPPGWPPPPPGWSPAAGWSPAPDWPPPPPDHPWWVSVVDVRRLRLLSVLWVLALSLWGPLGMDMVVDGPASGDRVRLVALASLAGVGLVASVALGCAVGRHRLWRLLAVEALLGTAVEMAWYVMVSASSSEPGADNAAGAGLVVLSPVVLAVLGVLLCLGGGLGALASRRRVDAG